MAINLLLILCFSGYLIVGKDPARQKFSDAETREVPVLSLNMLNSVLNGIHSFADVESMPTLTIESLEGNAYKPGGGVLPAVSKTATSTQKVQAKKAAKKQATAQKAEDKKPAAKKTTKAKKERKEQPPSDRSSVAKAAIAAAEMGRNIHRAIEAGAAPSVAASSTSTAIVSAAAASSTSTAIVNGGGGKAKFVIPRPGVNGAIPGILDGKRFVLTGIFPEVGGGSGLNLGKDRMEGMIEAFGGTVTGSVSGKTGKLKLNITCFFFRISLMVYHCKDYVIVGRKPGASKVGKAHQRGIPLLDILSLERLLYGRTQFEQIANEPPPRIEAFSSGYGGNGLLCGE